MLIDNQESFLIRIWFILRWVYSWLPKDSIFWPKLSITLYMHKKTKHSVIACNISWYDWNNYHISTLDINMFLKRFLIARQCRYYFLCYFMIFFLKISKPVHKKTWGNDMTYTNGIKLKIFFNLNTEHDTLRDGLKLHSYVVQGPFDSLISFCLWKYNLRAWPMSQYLFLKNVVIKNLSWRHGRWNCKSFSTFRSVTLEVFQITILHQFFKYLPGFVVLFQYFKMQILSHLR